MKSYFSIIQQGKEKEGESLPPPPKALPPVLDTLPLADPQIKALFSFYSFNYVLYCLDKRYCIC